MSKTLLCFVSTLLEVPHNVDAVELAALDNSFGVRRTDTGEVIVPAGTPMSAISPGIYTYEVDYPDTEFFLEVALTITRGANVSYITYRRYVPGPVFADADSFSDSESASVEDSQRRIELTKSPLELVTLPGYGDMFRLTLTASFGYLMPTDIFAFQRRPASPLEPTVLVENFMFVATPFDSTIYPVGNPDPTRWPVFYRKRELVLYVPSSEIAKFVYDSFDAEVKALVAAYNLLDQLEVIEEVDLDGSGIPEPVYETAEPPICSGYEFATGEQLTKLTSEVAQAWP